MLIRISLNTRDATEWIVEKGENTGKELSEKEKAEYQQLKEKLDKYGPYINFGSLSMEERQTIEGIQKRLKELVQISESQEVIWTPTPREEIDSIIAIIHPGTRSNSLPLPPIYVENMPQEWLDKLFFQQIVIENLSMMPATISAPVAGPPPDFSTFKEDPNVSAFCNTIRQVIFKIKEKPKEKASQSSSWLDLVTITDHDSYIRIEPIRFLGKDWQPVNNALTSFFGTDRLQWVSEGKESHWKVFLKK